MSDAPERIWAGAIADQWMPGYATRVWGDDPRVGTDEPAVEYVRADRIEALEAALLAAEQMAGCLEALLKLDAGEGTRSTVHNVTARALAAFRTAGEDNG